MRNFFTLWWMYKKKRLTRWVNLSFSVVSRGFEPRQTEPKPVVLPLHHETIGCFVFQKRCKVTTFCWIVQIFLQLFLKFFISGWCIERKICCWCDIKRFFYCVFVGNGVFYIYFRCVVWLFLERFERKKVNCYANCDENE